MTEDLNDVTLVDEDASSIQTDHAYRTIQGDVAMHVILLGKQSGATWWPNL